MSSKSASRTHAVYTTKSRPHTVACGGCDNGKRKRPTLEDVARDSTRPKRNEGPNSLSWKYDYYQHRSRVQTAKSLVDSTSPQVSKNYYTSPAKFNRQITNFVRIERENAMMLRRIATIMQGPPTIDNRLNFKHHSINIRSKAREMTLLRIAFDNLEMWKRIQSVRPTYDRRQQVKDYEKMEKLMGYLSYYPLFWKISSHSGFECFRERALRNATIEPRPKVFLSLETDEKVLGNVVIELRADVVPLTAENFRCLCTGEMGISYKCSEIHRIIPDVLWQGGEVVGKDGKGGANIFGGPFPDENFKLKHDGAGTVSMANYDKDTNGSQFMIAATKLGVLDNVNVVVGKVVGGMDVLRGLKSLLTVSGSIKKKIWIADCGSGEDSGGGGDVSQEYKDADEEEVDAVYDAMSETEEEEEESEIGGNRRGRGKEVRGRGPPPPTSASEEYTDATESDAEGGN